MLRDLRIAPQEYSFVHIRRGDYHSWPSRTHPAVLPDAWVVQAAQQLRDRQNPSLPLLVFGDDDAVAREVAEAVGGTYVHASESVDLRLMSLARSGVLSASTFSLWGANLAKLHHGAPGPWFAPELWGGIRLGRWFPEHLRVEWLTYLDVQAHL